MFYRYGCGHPRRSHQPLSLRQTVDFPAGSFGCHHSIRTFTSSKTSPGQTFPLRFLSSVLHASSCACATHSHDASPPPPTATAAAISVTSLPSRTGDHHGSVYVRTVHIHEDITKAGYACTYASGSPARQESGEISGTGK